eukprot:gene27770-biopygen11497
MSVTSAGRDQHSGPVVVPLFDDPTAFDEKEYNNEFVTDSEVESGVDEDDNDEMSELSSESDESCRYPVSDDDEDIAGMPPLMNDDEADHFLEGL